jgi:hypothetical protein
MTNMEISDRERALILTMRRMRNGTLEKVGVVNGEPGVIIATTQRIDLQREDELTSALSGGHVPLPLPMEAHKDEEDG